MKTPREIPPPTAADTPEASPPAQPPLPLLLEDQVRRWDQNDPVLVDYYVAHYPALRHHPEALLDLIQHEWVLRQEHGETPDIDHYLASFPELAEDLRMQWEVHGALPDGRLSDALTRSVERSSATEGDERPAAVQEPGMSGYEILGELGRGGMGVVYKAYDSKHQKLVALKTMQHLDGSALYRFKQEFRALAGLSHPNLVTLYELVSDGQHCFFTMELVEGVNFLEHVRGGAPSFYQQTTGHLESAREPEAAPRAGGLLAEQLTRLRTALAQLTEGILALHDAGTLHRDIKPGNVLVTPQGRVVLLDFGLAAELDRAGLHQSTEAHILGTVAYMAPEQAAGQPVSTASDWYAVGVMLYEALTGTLPFEGRTLEVLMNKQEIDPPAPRALVPDLPEDLDTLTVALLRRDAAARPSGQEILRRLGVAPAGDRAGAAPPGGRRPGTGVPLIGRQRHLRELADAFLALQRGQTVVVRVPGRSGAGKTALVQHFLSELEERGEAVVLAGRCYEQESVPYKALDSVMDALSRFLRRLPLLEAQVLLPRDVLALARVFPVLRRVEAVARAPQRPGDTADPHEMRRRATAALRELLGRLGDRQPLVVAIDDLQWGDVDSAALLADLLRPPRPPTLLLLICYRSEEAGRSPCLARVLQPPEAGDPLERRELPVEPLSEEEGQELVLALLAQQDAQARTRARAIARESGGNPFFVYELVQFLESGAGPAGDVSGPAGDFTLHEVLWNRIRRLPEETRRLLEVVAVAGRPLRHAHACAAAGWPAEDLAVLLALRSGRLLRTVGQAEGNEIETYHDRIRETIMTHLAPEALRQHHRRLAEVLEASGEADAEVLAVHFEGAGESGVAGGYYAQAAIRAAETLAFDRAAKLFRLALDLQRPTGAQLPSGWLRRQLADALANAGRGAESAREYQAATAGADPADALDLQQRAALQFLISGHVDDGVATLRTVLGRVGMRLPGTGRGALLALLWRRLQVRLRGLRFRRRTLEEVPAADLTRINICWSAAVGLSMVDVVQGAYFQTRSLLLALRAGEPYYVARALALEAAHSSIGGGQTRRRTARLLEAAQELARQVDQPYVLALVDLARGIAAALAGEWRPAVTLCDQAEATFRRSCTGVVWELDTAHRFALWPLMFMGEVREMNERVPRLLKEAQERDDLYAVANLSLVLRPFTRLAADEPERAREDVRGVIERWSQQGFHVQHMNQLHDEVQIDLYQGEGTRAWERLTGQWRRLRQLHFLRVQQVRIFLLHLRGRCALAAAAVTAARGGLLRAAERDAGALERERMAWAAPLAQALRAEVARQRGDRDRAAALLAEAVERFDAVPMRLHAAATRRRLGQLLGGARGQALVAQADAWMAEQNIVNPARMTAMLAPGLAE